MLRKYLALVVCVATVTLPRVSKLSAQTNSSQNKMQTPYTQLEAAAVSALGKTDQPSVSQLASAVYQVPHYFTLQPIAMSSYSDKLVQSELEFRDGASKGVSEQELVDLANSVQNRLGLPAYLRTTPQQVRIVRMRCFVDSPQFMISSLPSHGLKKGERISPYMSPLQALHIFSILIDQKVHNPDFQDPSVDADKVHAERLQRMKIRSELLGIKKSAQLGTLDGSKTVEVRTSLYKSISSLSADDTAQMIQSVIGTFTK